MQSFLIQNGAVLAADGWLDPGYVWIAEGIFVAVAPGSPPPTLLSQAHTIIEARHCAVLPGLVNGHTHLSQTLMRGRAGGRPLLTWLRDIIWPLQAALTPEAMKIAALLGLVENLLCGVTHVVDHHKLTTTPAHTDAVCEAAEAVGVRLTLARAWTDLGAAAESPSTILADLARLYERWNGHPRIRIANGPLALWRCSTETLQAAHALAYRWASTTHIHVAESRDEVQMSLEAHGLPPVAWLADRGLLDESTDVVHAVWVTPPEIEQLAASGARVVHCPVSNAVLGSGIAPVAAMLAQGIHLRLGSDGPASNDTQDIFETLKTAVCLARATTGDATVLPPKQALRLALDRPAILPGAPADCIVVNLDHPRAMPVHDVTSALVLSTHGSDVRSVFVDGRLLVHEGQVISLDMSALLDASRAVLSSLPL